MGDSFTVHLVSNVSPDLFPKNDAAKFSTNLADELDVSEGEWEVAVRQIMYPTHIATTTDTDTISIHSYKDVYRNLLPFPSEKTGTLEKMSTMIDLSPKVQITENDKFQAHILNVVNNSVWKDIIKLEVHKSSKKFILHIYDKDIVVWMSKETSKCLGFKNQCSFSKGTTWSWTQFNHKSIPTNNFKIFLCDLSLLQQTTHVALKMRNYSQNIYFYEGKIGAKFSEKWSSYNIPFSISPEEGLVIIDSSKSNIDDTIAFIKIDEYVSYPLGLRSIYSLNDFEKKTHHFYLQTKKVRVKDEHGFDPEDYIAIDTLSVTIYYNSVKDFMKEPSPIPISSFVTASKTEINQPKHILTYLNSKSKDFDYQFSFDSLTKRFKLKVGSKHALKLSESLLSILGFVKNENEYFHANSLYTASDFPTMNRSIAALYVYTNIVDSVYIGDVKAPLLLTCPFKKTDPLNIVHQQEFLNPCYVPLNRSRIHQIDIAIYDDTGVLIPFLYGKTKLSLDFRRKR